MPEEKPRVSIITPVFNRAHIIHKTIDSVIEQTCPFWELLLVDDGSTDDIEQVMQQKYGQDRRISFMRRDREPQSASTCRNIGAEKARGDYLIFLDSDDWLEPFCLEQRVKVMDEEPDLNFAVFPSKYLAPDGKYVLSNFDNGIDPLVNFLSNKSYWQTTCPIWRKSVFLEIGGFNPRFPRYQDPEFHIRALLYHGIRYKMFLNHDADVIVVPSEKKLSFYFALDIYESLKMLVIQTHAALKKADRLDLMKHMEGYLKEWLALFAYANFSQDILIKAQELLRLFYDLRIISLYRFKRHEYSIRAASVVVKIVKKLYIMSLHR